MRPEHRSRSGSRGARPPRNPGAPRARTQLAGAAALGVLYALLAREVVRDDPTMLDRALHDAAADTYSRTLEMILSPIEVIGLPGLYIPIAGLVARRLARRRRGGGPTIVKASVAGWLSLRLSRMLYARVRPPRPAHRGPKTERSFPSGHTTGLTTLAVATALVLEREGVLTRVQASALGVGVPLLTAFNRVYVREHWATDAVGGWLLGTAVALGITARAPRRSRGAAQRAARRST